MCVTIQPLGCEIPKMKQEQMPLFDRNTLEETVINQHNEIEKLRSGIKKFVDKNYFGGSKAQREDYAQMVSAKDIFDLKELIK